MTIDRAQKADAKMNLLMIKAQRPQRFSGVSQSDAYRTCYSQDIRRGLLTTGFGFS